MNQPLVLIEPAAGNVENGHYQEKLELWIRAARTAGYEPVVVGWEPPPSELRVAWRAFDRRLVSLPLRFIPDRRRVMWIEFIVYAAGLRLARQLSCPVIGLTACSPITVAAGALLQRQAVPGYGQILMYAGLHESGGLVTLREICRKALAAIQKKGGTLLPNAPSMVDLLRPAFSSGSRMQYLPDPIEVPDVTESEISGKMHAASSLLVSGKDDHRRTPLGHFQRFGGLEHFERLWLQYPEKREAALADGTRWLPPSELRFEFVNHYVDRASLIDLFRGSKFSAVIYAPSFFQGSGHLAFSVACGTPVLASNFPYARDMFAKFGRLGERFDYQDKDGFLAAIDRLLAWGPLEYSEFIDARRSMIAEVNHEAVVKKALETLGYP